MTKIYKFTLAQINPTIGDFDGIEKKIKAIIEKERSLGTDLVVFPELAITGYPPMDFLLKKDFIKRAAGSLKNIASATNKIAVLLGLPTENKNTGNPLFNSIAFIRNKKIIKIGHKQYLPNYDVFDEARYFEPGKESLTVSLDDIKLGLTVCEDLWDKNNFLKRKLYSGNLLKTLSGEKIDFLINISASPYHRGKAAIRNRLIKEIAKRNKWHILYVNQVGGQDSLIFDGASAIWDQSGKLLAQGAFFEEDLVRFAFQFQSKNESNQKKKPGIIPRERHITEKFLKKQGSAGFMNEMTIRALTLGIRDYVRKLGFSKVLVGLSGGIDSALVAYLACKAIGSGNVRAFLMPSKFSSQGSIFDAQDLCQRNNIEFTIYSIHELYQSYLKELKCFLPGDTIETAHENIQARIRGNILMSYANKFNTLVLATSNKSESAVGYATLYGDMAGGLAPIADVPKTLVYELCRYINKSEKDPEPIPVNILTKAPSAELRPNQKDSDSLPEYEVLDLILEEYNDNLKSAPYIAKRLSRQFSVGKGEAIKTVKDIICMIEKAEYKRKQAAIALKVTQKDFTNGRRFPIVQKYRE